MERLEECCEELELDPLQVEADRRALLSNERADALAGTFKALADPTRVKLLSLLAEHECCVGELAAVLELSISAVSHQLRLLRALRVVRARREGRHIYYALDDEHIRLMVQYGLNHLEHA